MFPKKRSMFGRQFQQQLTTADFQSISKISQKMQNQAYRARDTSMNDTSSVWYYLGFNHMPASIAVNAGTSKQKKTTGVTNVDKVHIRNLFPCVWTWLLETQLATRILLELRATVSATGTSKEAYFVFFSFTFLFFLISCFILLSPFVFLLFCFCAFLFFCFFACLLFCFFCFVASLFFLFACFCLFAFLIVCFCAFFNNNNNNHSEFLQTLCGREALRPPPMHPPPAFLSTTTTTTTRTTATTTTTNALRQPQQQQTANNKATTKLKFCDM